MFWNSIKLWWNKKKFIKNSTEEATDLFLEILLVVMSLYLRLNKEYRRNIKDFNARYSFRSSSGNIDAGVVFSNDLMTIHRKQIDNTNISVVFKDAKTLRNFLFSDNPDIIGAVLNGDVSYKGNLNYLSKFAYMAKNLKKRLLPG